MNVEELQRKRQALDRLLEQTETDMHELQVLLRQRSAEILARVERDLTAQVETCVPEVQQHLKRFRTQHSKETGRTFGAFLEDFLMMEVEMVFRKWRTQEDEKIQIQLDALSTRFVTQANGILERLKQTTGALFEIPVEHLAISCPLRVESRLHYKVDRVFYSLDSFLLLLPRLILRPIVLRRMHNNVPRLLDVNAGRIRYDYLERLQSSMGQFERDLRTAITMVTESLKSALHMPGEKRQQYTETSDLLDSVIRDCSYLVQ
jgi:hypothetical protein